MLLNNCRVNNLDNFNDIDQTGQEINRLREQAEHIESICGPSLRTKKLRDEILRLENDLLYLQKPVSPSLDIYL